MADLARQHVGEVVGVSVDLLSRIFYYLPLTEFFKCSLVSHEWREGGTITFATQLQWRDAVQVRRVSLPPLAGGTREEEDEDDVQHPLVRRAAGLARFMSTGSSRVVALVADPEHQAVRSFQCFGGRGQIKRTSCALQYYSTTALQRPHHVVPHVQTVP